MGTAQGDSGEGLHREGPWPDALLLSGPVTHHELGQAGS